MENLLLSMSYLSYTFEINTTIADIITIVKDESTQVVILKVLLCRSIGVSCCFMTQTTSIFLQNYTLQLKFQLILL